MVKRIALWIVIVGLAALAVKQQNEIKELRSRPADPAVIERILLDAAAREERVRAQLQEALERVQELERELEAVGEIQAFVRAVNPEIPPSQARMIARLLYESAERHRVDWRLAVSLAAVESRFDPGAVSRRGALGVMQLMPETAQALGVDNPFDVAQNIDAGVRYLAWLLRRYGGNWDLAVAAYNAGPSRVTDRVPEIRETQRHVRRVQLASRGLRGARQ